MSVVLAAVFVVVEFEVFVVLVGVFVRFVAVVLVVVFLAVV